MWEPTKRISDCPRPPASRRLGLRGRKFNPSNRDILERDSPARATAHLWLGCAAPFKKQPPRMWPYRHLYYGCQAIWGIRAQRGHEIELSEAIGIGAFNLRPHTFILRKNEKSQKLLITKVVRRSFLTLKSLSTFRKSPKKWPFQEGSAAAASGASRLSLRPRAKSRKYILFDIF